MDVVEQVIVPFQFQTDNKRASSVPTGRWAGGGRDRGIRGGVIGIIATVRERWLWPDEAAMFDPLAVREAAGRVGGMRVGPRLRSVENPWETSVRAGGRRCGRHCAGSSIREMRAKCLT